MTFTAPESLSEQIAKYLAQRIIRGEMLPGERIQELRVVNELEVSRGSVREALLILERRHLIDILPRRGALVSRLTADKARALYDIYIHLLIMLSNGVALGWNEGNIQQVGAQIEKMKRLSGSGDAEAFIESCFALMREAFVIVNNPYLAQLLEDLEPAIHRTYSLAVRYQPQEAVRASVFFTELFNAALRREVQRIPGLLNAYGDQQCELVVAALNKEALACA
ncbi:GntR family transcriptional regulator [Thalassolituus sp. LLYu03]|uniref:GntR family transcriptional regulator n=1 Tax=Thalassolituus sp. LLYu03 TaxID=3421656 RepID=UPI003D269B4B